jgi:hypothetical protein
MLCAVSLLRRHGLRLRPSELAPAVSGDLELADHAGASTFGRGMRVANLWQPTHSGTRRALLVPLWDPALIWIGPRHLTLIGIELCARDGRVAECTQLWRCIPRAAPDDGHRAAASRHGQA